jgi:ATP-binding cassette, subfamily B, bacterial
MRPYRGRVALAGVFLVLAALSTLAFPVALKVLIDQGLVAADPGERLMALRGTSWRCSAWARRWACSRRALLHGQLAGRAHHGRPAQRRLRPRAAQSPSSSRPRRPARCCRRLTTDTTLVQTVVGSSLSMGLRNTVMGAGALARWSSPTPG